MSQPEVLRRRNELEEKETEVSAPVRHPFFQEKESKQKAPSQPASLRPVVDEAAKTSLPAIPEKQESPLGLYDNLVAGYKSTARATEGSRIWADVRKAELAGDTVLANQLRERAQQKFVEAERNAPRVKSAFDVQNVRDAFDYGAGLVGSAVESVATSVAGGAAGGALGSAAGLLPPLRPISSALRAAGAFGGAILPQAKAVKGSIAMSQDLDPVIGRMPVEDRERAATLTATGSLALEGLVPAAIGARVGGRAVQRGRQLQGRFDELPQKPPLTGTQRFALDSFDEGLTELGQTNFEQFALSLQNSDLDRFADLEESVNSFLGGAAGGAFANVQGRAMEYGIDLAAGAIDRVRNKDAYAEINKAREEYEKRIQNAGFVSGFNLPRLPRVPGWRAFSMLLDPSYRLNDLATKKQAEGELGEVLNQIQQGVQQAWNEYQQDPENAVAPTLPDILNNVETSPQNQKVVNKLLTMIELQTELSRIQNNPDYRDQFGNYFPDLKVDDTPILSRESELQTRVNNLLKDSELTKAFNEQDLRDIKNEVERVYRQDQPADPADTVQMFTPEDEGPAPGESVNDDFEITDQDVTAIFGRMSGAEEGVAQSGARELTEDEALTLTQINFDEFQSIPYTHKNFRAENNRIFERPVQLGTYEQDRFQKKFLQDNPFSVIYGDEEGNADPFGTQVLDRPAFELVQERNGDIVDVNGNFAYIGYYDFIENKTRGLTKQIPEDEIALRAAQSLDEDYANRSRSGSPDKMPEVDDLHTNTRAKLQELINIQDTKERTRRIKEYLNTQFKMPMVRKQQYQDYNLERSEFMSDYEMSRAQRSLNWFNKEQRENGAREEAFKAAIPIVVEYPAAERAFMKRDLESRGIRTAEPPKYRIVYLSRQGLQSVEGAKWRRDNPETFENFDRKNLPKIQQLESSAISRVLARPEVIGIAARDEDGRVLFEDGPAESFNHQDDQKYGAPLLQVDNLIKAPNSDIPLTHRMVDGQRVPVQQPEAEYVTPDVIRDKNAPQQALNRIPFSYIRPDKYIGPYSDSLSRAEYRRETLNAQNENAVRFMALNNVVNTQLKPKLDTIKENILERLETENSEQFEAFWNALISDELLRQNSASWQFLVGNLKKDQKGLLPGLLESLLDSDPNDESRSLTELITFNDDSTLALYLDAMAQVSRANKEVSAWIEQSLINPTAEPSSFAVQIGLEDGVLRGPERVIAKEIRKGLQGESYAMSNIWKLLDEQFDLNKINVSNFLNLEYVDDFLDLGLESFDSEGNQLSRDQVNRKEQWVKEDVIQREAKIAAEKSKLHTKLEKHFEPILDVRIRKTVVEALIDTLTQLGALETVEHTNDTIKTLFNARKQLVKNFQAVVDKNVRESIGKERLEQLLDTLNEANINDIIVEGAIGLEQARRIGELESNARLEQQSSGGVTIEIINAMILESLAVEQEYTNRLQTAVQNYNAIREQVIEEGNAIAEETASMEAILEDLYPDGVPDEYRQQSESITDSYRKEDLLNSLEAAQLQAQQFSDFIENQRTHREQIYNAYAKFVTNEQSNDIARLDPTNYEWSGDVNYVNFNPDAQQRTDVSKAQDKIKLAGKKKKRKKSKAYRALQLAERLTSLVNVSPVMQSPAVQELMPRAKAFITDRKLDGKKINNVNAQMAGVTVGDVILVLKDDDTLSTGFKTAIKRAAEKGAVVAFSTDGKTIKPSKKGPPNSVHNELHTFMYTQGYRPVKKAEGQIYYPDTTQQVIRDNESFRVKLERMRDQEREFLDVFEKNQKVLESNLLMQAWVWRLSVELDGYPRLNDKYNRPYGLTKKQLNDLKKDGFELRNWLDDYTQQVSLTKIHKKESKLDKKAEAEAKAEAKAKPTTVEDKRKQEETDYKTNEKARRLAAAQTTSTQIRKAIEGISDLSSPEGFAAITELFKSFNYTRSEQRMRRDLQRSILSNKRIGRDIRALLKKNPTKLTADQLKSIVNDENAYYAYAFQMHMLGELQVTPRSEEWFRQIVQYLLGLIGITTRAGYTEALFTDINARKVQNRDDLPAFYTRASAPLDDLVAQSGRLVHTGIERGIATSVDVLTRFGPEGKALANSFFIREFESGVSIKNNNFIAKRQRQTDAWNLRFRKNVYDKYSEKEFNEGWDDFVTNNDKVTTKAGKDIKNFVDEFYRYMDRRGARLTIRKSEDEFETILPSNKNWKVPSAWDTTQITDNETAFRALLRKNGLNETEIDQFVSSLKWANGHVSFLDSKWDKEARFWSTETRTGTGVLSNYSQIVNSGNISEFKKFLHKDGMFSIGRMVQQGVHKAEFTNAFGRNGSQITDFLLNLEAQGLPQSELRYVERTIDGLLGNLTYNMNPTLRSTIGSIVAIENMSILPLIIFSSLPELWGSTIASGEIKSAYTSLKHGLAEIVDSLNNKPDEIEQLAQEFGVLSEDIMTNRISDVYNEMMAGSTIKNMNQKFFKLTGLEQWTKGLRIGAFHMAHNYIYAHKNDAKKLAPLNLKPEDVKFDSNGNLIFNTTDPDDPVIHAINTFVDQSVLRPTAAHRPAWGSDPRFLLIWHLKQFTWAFHNVYTTLLMKEMFARDEGEKMNWALVNAMVMMVPTIMVGDLIKNIVFPSTGYWEHSTFTDHLYSGVQRSGVAGLGSLVMDEYENVTTFNDHVGASLLGPTYSHMQEFFGNNPTKGIMRMVPGWAAWNRWV